MSELGERVRDGVPVVIGVDPGRRVGLAWVDADGRLLRLAVVDLDAVDGLAPAPTVAVALGDGTGSRAVRARLEAAGMRPVLVDERRTSEEGRALYWRLHRPRGWRRWLPVGLRGAPADLDAYAAYAIARRWLAARGGDG